MKPSLERRTSDLIESLLIAQVSNVDPDDHETILNRWRFLISDAIGRAQDDERDAVGAPPHD